MDEVITCKCGCQKWVIGTSGTRCGKCGTWLPAGSVNADIRKLNFEIKQLSRTDGARPKELNKTTEGDSDE